MPDDSTGQSPLSDMLAAEREDGEHDLRRQLLLWVARNRYARSDPESYADVLDAQVALASASGVALRADAAFISNDESSHHIVWLRFFEATSGTVTSRDLTALREEMRAISSTPLRELVSELVQASSQINSNVGRESAALQDALRREPLLALVTPHDLTDAQRRRLQEQGGAGAWEIFDRRTMLALHRTLTDPQVLPATIQVSTDPDGRLQTTSGGYRVVVAPVPVKLIIEWPGIDDKRLFDLNVRLGLGHSRVRTSLARTLEDDDDQSGFLAYHNGLTVVTNHIDLDTPGLLRISGLSVVNGAQSVLAFKEHKDSITDSLRVLVKFVEVGGDRDFAQNIAIRSNTQNPVTTRNLRALDAVQLRIVAELAKQGVIYGTKPEAGAPTGPNFLANDDAAQLLAAVYLEEPWLAVKRNELFAPGTYRRLFPLDLSPWRVLLVHRVRQAVTPKSDFPADYQRAWRLVVLIVVYLAGQLLRAERATDQVVTTPDPDSIAILTRQDLPHIMAFVTRQLNRHHEEQLNRFGFDNFRVDFKRQKTLRELSAKVVAEWRRDRRLRHSAESAQ